MAKKWKKVLVTRKVTSDVCGAALLGGVTPNDKVEALDGDADEANLANPEILCIGVGGEGRVAERNFDSRNGVSATRQALNLILDLGMDAHAAYKLVGYIDQLIADPASVKRPKGFLVKVFTLPDIFAGMLLVKKEPEDQLRAGVEILKKVISQKINPFGGMPVSEVAGWPAYAAAKDKAEKAVKSARRVDTNAGRTLAWLETDFTAAPAALFERGAEIVVTFRRQFGPNKAPHFTITGDGIQVTAALGDLYAAEGGYWAALPSGTTVISPREGSRLTLGEVVEIVKSTL